MESTDTTTSASGTGGDQAQGKGGMIDRVKERAAAQLSNQKEKATDGLGSVAAMVRQGTQQLRDQRHDTIAGYVDQAADQIEKFSRQLRDKDVGELLDDAQRLARRRPAVFIGSAFAIGVIGARFFKSSSEHDRRHAGQDAGRPFDYGGGVYGSSSSTRGNHPAVSSVGVNAAAFDDTSESRVWHTGFCVRHRCEWQRLVPVDR